MTRTPAFDGRRERTGWVAVTPTNGWSGAVYYKFSGGMETLILDLIKTAWGAELMVQLPPEAVPSALPAGTYFYGMSRSSGAQAPCYLTNTGGIGCVFGSTTTGGGGIVGTLTIPR